jgi:hypothetical protein
MRAQSLADPQIEFVFGRIDDKLRGELQVFWLKHLGIYRAEIKAFRTVSGSKLSPFNVPQRSPRRQPAAICRDTDGTIVGIVFVVLRELQPEIGFGTHAYFQRMYVDPSLRKPKLANQLFKEFLRGFDRAADARDYRASILMAENINPGLQKPFMRRYFSRLGFRLLGKNKLGGEVWARKLQTRFVF